MRKVHRRSHIEHLAVSIAWFMGIYMVVRLGHIAGSGWLARIIGNYDLARLVISMLSYLEFFAEPSQQVIATPATLPRQAGIRAFHRPRRPLTSLQRSRGSISGWLPRSASGAMNHKRLQPNHELWASRDISLPGNTE